MNEIEYLIKLFTEDQWDDALKKAGLDVSKPSQHSINKGG